MTKPCYRLFIVLWSLYTAYLANRFPTAIAAHPISPFRTTSVYSTVGVKLYRLFSILSCWAALRVAKYHGRGPAFQRVIAAQARFFEANGALKPSYQGKREKSNGLLDDEGFYLGGEEDGEYQMKGWEREGDGGGSGIVYETN
ncbi:hypothetical protein B0H11DRAFT_1908281 [Mycena galericulata]|nr:hypothetical protein B0H11DRAFT_1908281 [Mycena galericulata]